jgi:hypothetical protein
MAASPRYVHITDMTRKSEPRPKLTDAERHKRFVEMAREVEASEDPKDFEKAFKKVARRRVEANEKTGGNERGGGSAKTRPGSK